MDLTRKVEPMYDRFASGVAQEAFALFVDQNDEPTVGRDGQCGHVELALDRQSLSFVA